MRARPPRPAIDSQQGWPAFTDLLGAFVLVIFLTLLFFLINFRKAESTAQARGRQLAKKEKLLQHRETQIARQRSKLKQEREANRRLLEDLRQTERNLRKTVGAKKTLELMFEKLKKERLEIEKARKKAEEALAKALRSRSLAEQERQRCQRQIETYIGVRRRIIQRIYASLRSELREPSQVRFDTKGGSISLGAGILFRLGRWSLQTKGKKNLRRVWRKIHHVLKHPLNRPYIAGIVIEGYTSSEGSGSYNWSLSTRRAYAALRFLMRHGASLWSKQGLISAAGFGHTRPVKHKGVEDKAASRRIEIRVRFRDREKLEELMRQFQNIKPTPKTPTPSAPVAPKAPTAPPKTPAMPKTPPKVAPTTQKAP